MVQRRCRRHFLAIALVLFFAASVFYIRTSSNQSGRVLLLNNLTTNQQGMVEVVSSGIKANPAAKNNGKTKLILAYTRVYGVIFQEATYGRTIEEYKMPSAAE